MNEFISTIKKDCDKAEKGFDNFMAEANSQED